MSKATQRLSFAQWDVFTARALEGNSLAVFPDARGLTDDQMQAIAREFNFSETTFVFPDEASANRPRVRIFTPSAEVDFAGHPTIGTACALVMHGCLGADLGVPARLILEENVGAGRRGGRAPRTQPCRSDQPGDR